MNKTKSLLLAVAVAAMAFTVSCSSGSDNISTKNFIVMSVQCIKNSGGI